MYFPVFRNTRFSERAYHFQCGGLRQKLNPANPNLKVRGVADCVNNISGITDGFYFVLNVVRTR